MDKEAAIAAITKKANLLKWGIGIGAAVLLGPLIWALAFAMLGVAAAGAATALAAIVGLAIINFAPVVAMKFQNAKLKAIMAEATANPIETLWNGHEQDARELADMNSAIEDYATEIGNVQSSMQKLTSDLTPDDMASFQRDVDALTQDLALQEADYAQAQRDHAAQEVQIKRAAAIWKLNMAVNKANAKNMNRAEETMAKIKRETALDSVTASMNRSKAQLRARIRDRMSVSTVGTGAPAALTHQPADVLEVPVTVVSNVKVQR